MPRKTQALAYISGTLTQGSADAFVQLTIATALSGQTKTCYRLASLEFELGQVRSAASGADYQFVLTRKSYSALPTSPMLEKSMIYYTRLSTTQLTAVGFGYNDRTYTRTWSDDDAPIIVEDPIYAQLDSASTSVANVLYFRLGYWLDSISEVDRLQLVANSLS